MTLVYVLDQRGNPLMPTSRCGHVRHLLKAKKAVVVKTKPFTIRLKYKTDGACQPIILGIDPGRTNIGLCAVTENGKPLFSSNLETNTKMFLSAWQNEPHTAVPPGKVSGSAANGEL